MTPWAWHWRLEGDEGYGGDHPTRESAVADAENWLSPGEHFEIIEARMSEAAEHDDTDIIPFLRTRNHEFLVVRAALKGG